MLQLRSQTLVESYGTSLCAAIVDNGGHCDIGSHASNGHNVAVVLLYHGGHELSHSEEMGEGVNLKRPANRSLRLVKNGHGITNSSVVDQDCGIAMRLANLSADSGEVFRGGHIGLVEVDASFGRSQYEELC